MKKTRVASAKPANAYHHGDLRKALVSATLAAIEQTEPGAISLAATAKALGVSQAAPYRHFPDRDALLAAVAAEGFRLFSAGLLTALSATSDGSGLSRMGHAYVEFGLSRPGLYQLMFASDLLSHATEGGELKSAAQASFNLLVAALGPDADAGQRRRRATRIWAGLHGAVMLASRGLLGRQPAAVKIADLVEDILA